MFVLRIFTLIDDRICVFRKSRYVLYTSKSCQVLVQYIFTVSLHHQDCVYGFIGMKNKKLCCNGCYSSEKLEILQNHLAGSKIFETLKMLLKLSDCRVACLFVKFTASPEIRSLITQNVAL